MQIAAPASTKRLVTRTKKIVECFLVIPTKYLVRNDQNGIGTVWSAVPWCLVEQNNIWYLQLKYLVETTKQRFSNTNQIIGICWNQPKVWFIFTRNAHWIVLCFSVVYQISFQPNIHTRILLKEKIHIYISKFYKYS